jgi:hypothetical protein
LLIIGIFIIRSFSQFLLTKDIKNGQFISYKNGTFSYKSVESINKKFLENKIENKIELNKKKSLL